MSTSRRVLELCEEKRCCLFIYSNTKMLSSFIKRTAKTSDCNIGSLYQRHVTDIRDGIYNSIGGGIIVQIQIVFVYIATLSYYTICISLVLNNLIHFEIMKSFQDI